MAIYDVDFQTTAVNLLPPDKRTPKMWAWLKALLDPLRTAAILFKWYREGISYDAFDSANDYNAGDAVETGGVIYVAKKFAPNGSNFTPYPDRENEYWQIVDGASSSVPYTITGANERVIYNSQKTRFEYALNKKFGGTFYQPPSNADIYISNNAPTNNSFVLGGAEVTSSVVYATGSTAFIYATYLTGITTNFTIYVPTSRLGSITGGANTVRQFADKYVLAGLTYSIATY